jgi:predicted DNA-binding protein
MSMRPYSLYLPDELIAQLKERAKERKSAAFVREAIEMALFNGDVYQSGYNAALRDAAKLVDGCKEIEVIAINGRYLADILMEQINGLKHEQ